MSLLLLLACGTPDDDTSGTTATGATDVRLDAQDLGDVPEGAELWYGPEVVIEPGQDAMWCLVGTYTGEDRGIREYVVYQNEFGHHLQLMGTTLSELDYPDGSTFDCTKSEDLPMAEMEPLILQTGSNNSDIAFTLPEGMAVKLDEGQRWVMQAHYINYGTEPILARDIAYLETVPLEAVETWAAPMVENHQQFTLPPHEASSSSHDCVVDTPDDQPVYLLYLLGHMHEWGTSFKTEFIRDGSVELAYEVPVWDAAYRDTPPTNAYAEGEVMLSEGDVIRTSCSWYNDTDTELGFPNEMCASVSVAYPSLTPIICSD